MHQPPTRRSLLLVSLHDVSPYHLPRLERAERLFAAWGVQKITYLLIPDYLGGQRADQSSEFAAFIGARRTFAVDWFLHGCYHLAWNDATNRSLSDLPPRATNRQLGEANNDEFLRIDGGAADRRLERGEQVFQNCLGARPYGFVAPRWQLGLQVDAVLSARRYCWTERHGQILHLPSGQRYASPVITWATRTPLRKLTSLLGTPLLSYAYRRAPILRMAMHPFDFDHPATIGSIERALEQAMGQRRQACYDELLANDERLPAPSRMAG